jgi:hypothetical protein
MDASGKWPAIWTNHSMVMNNLVAQFFGIFNADVISLRRCLQLWHFGSKD